MKVPSVSVEMLMGVHVLMLMGMKMLVLMIAFHVFLLSWRARRAQLFIR
ncbi:MAG: hypothetical protein LDL33_00120 [Desulfomonile sp.]|nr:hypothetical protein [Desulfomonile sp.]